MPKQRTGYVYFDKKRKTWTARLTYKDELGKTRNIKRQVANKTEGNILLKKLLTDIEHIGPAIIDGAKLTFAGLASIYQDEKLIEPVYEEDEDGGRVRVAGLRSYKDMRRKLKTLTAHFGAKRIATITHSDILKYKLKRLKDPIKRDAKRGIDSTPKIATAHRELQLLRAVLNFAKRKGWILRNPFELGESLVSMASERKRDRKLSREEEARLLAACETKPRAHIRPILIAALDTGLRKGELLKLKWLDIDLANGLIRLRATTTKTEQPRTVGMTGSRQTENVERIERAKKKYLYARVKALRLKAEMAFLAAGGARGDFAREWPSVFKEEVRGACTFDAASGN